MDVVAVRKIKESALSDLVGSDGTISPLQALAISGAQSFDVESDAGPLAFSFDYDGILFKANLERLDDDWRLQVTGDCGPVPYSIESQDLRRALLAVVDQTDPLSGGVLTVQPDQRMRLHGEWTVTAPITPGSLLTGPIKLILSARSTLDRVAVLLAAYMAPPLKLAS